MSYSKKVAAALFSIAFCSVDLFAASSSSSTPYVPTQMPPPSPVVINPVVTPTVTPSPSTTVRPSAGQQPVEKRVAEKVTPSTEPLRAIFTSPGVATAQEGRWVGTGHLYHIAPDFGVIVEVIHPEGVAVGIEEEALRDKVISILSNAGVGLHPRTTWGDNQTPLPFLHLLLMINPIENGYVLYCSARMFEAVTVERIHLKSDLTWQAITWEKQELLIFGSEQLENEVSQTVNRVLAVLVDKLKSYQGL